jgi:hypothetical protein
MRELGIIGPKLTHLIQQLPPDEAVALLSGFVGNVTGDLPDQFWKNMMDQAGIPCSDPDCDCHIEKRAMVDAANSIRDSYKRTK